MRFVRLVVLTFLFSTTFIFSQKDSLFNFRWGTFHPRLRYFFMQTTNDGPLSDYFSNAIGGGLKFESKSSKQLRFVVNTSVSGTLYSSDLTSQDPLTHQPNRYENSLMDVIHPNKDIIARLDELFLAYTRNDLQINLGKQFITTPFINPQDGRMNTTSIEGIWTKISPIDKLQLELGYLYKISPRSTTEWNNIGKSIGIYPTGVTTHGDKSTYSNHVNSDGIFALGTTFKPMQQIELKLWNYTILNVFNLVFIQPEYHCSINENNSLQFAGQFSYENTIGNGGNATPTLSYFQKNQQGSTAGSRINWKRKNTGISINYNYIFNQDRFTFPREWGREPFFTFLPRERMEGTAGSHAIALKTEINLPKHWMIHIGLGYYSFANVSNYAKNKYGIPSFVQMNSEFKYTLKNLDIQLLHCIKFNNEANINNTKYEINKVNLSQINVVLNYHL